MQASTQNASHSMFSRPDTLFGVCQAIGEDFGINPDWLRIALVPVIFFAPLFALVAYVTMGVAVFASRKIFPARRAATVSPAAPVEAPQVAANSDADIAAPADARRELPLAA